MHEQRARSVELIVILKSWLLWVLHDLLGLEGGLLLATEDVEVESLLVDLLGRGRALVEKGRLEVDTGEGLRRWIKIIYRLFVVYFKWRKSV